MFPKMKVEWSEHTTIRGLKGGGSGGGPDMMAATIRAVAEETIPEGILAGLHRAAKAAETFMQANASWQDQSGAARAGLQAYVVNTDGQVAMVLAHGGDIEYGLWLETRWGGRYAIIIPTWVAFGPRLEGFIKNEIELALAGRGSQFRHKASGRFV